MAAVGKSPLQGDNLRRCENVASWVKQTFKPNTSVQGLMPVKHVVDSVFFEQTHTGIVVCDLFGGLCAGLEAALRMGWCVNQYIYVDVSRAARAVAVYRVAQLMEQYPQQVAPDLLSSMFDFPQNIKEWSAATIQQALQLYEGAWFITAGWPCQDRFEQRWQWSGFGRGSQRFDPTFAQCHESSVAVCTSSGCVCSRECGITVQQYS